MVAVTLAMVGAPLARPDGNSWLVVMTLAMVAITLAVDTTTLAMVATTLAIIGGDSWLTDMQTMARGQPQKQSPEPILRTNGPLLIRGIDSEH